MLILISKHASAVTRKIKMKVTVMPGLYHDQCISEKDIAIAVQQLIFVLLHVCSTARIHDTCMQIYVTALSAADWAPIQTCIHEQSF